MKRIKALYKLSRPMTSLSGGLAVVVGGYVAGTGAWGKIGLACLATLFIAASANAWNDTLDIEIDRVNQPQRPLPAGLLTVEEARRFAFAAAAVSLLIASFINLPAFLTALVSNILLILYSLRLKTTVLIGNATVAAISAMSAVFGGMAAGNVRPTLWLALIISFGIMGREVLKTLADYEGDLRYRCRTVATVWGRRWARVIFFALAATTLIIMMIPYLIELYNPIYAYVVGIGVYPVILYITMRVTRDRTGPQLEKLSQLLKYDFLIWFLAVVLGTT